MADFEYKVVAAPKKTKAFRGVRAHEDQFAHVLMEIMNEQALHNWEYLRAESLPCEEKTGLTSRVESYQSVLVFRRAIVSDQKFFDIPPTHQLEVHSIAEDVVESDVVFASSQRPSVVASVAEDTGDAEAPAGTGDVLSILRSRKARQAREDMDTYPEHMKQAAE